MMWLPIPAFSKQLFGGHISFIDQRTNVYLYTLVIYLYQAVL